MIAWLVGVALAVEPDWSRGDEILARIEQAAEPCPVSAAGREADKQLYDALGAWLGPLRGHEERVVRVRARVVGLSGVTSLVDRLQRGDACCVDCYEQALWVLDRRALEIEESLVRDVSDAVRLDDADGPALCELVPTDLISPLRMGCQYAAGARARPPAPMAEPQPTPRALRMPAPD